MKLFQRKKLRHHAALPVKKVKKEKKTTHAISSEFKKKRTHNFRYIFSLFRFRTNKIIARIAAFSLIIVLVVVSVILIFFSKFLSVQHIKLVRKDFRVDSEAISFSMQEFRDQNIIFVSKKAIQTKLLQNHPSIQSLEITKEYPQTLVLTVSTYPISAQLKIKVNKENLLVGGKQETTEQTVFVNQVGMATNGTSEDTNVFLIEDQDPRDDFVNEGQNVIDQNILQQIHSTRQTLENLLNTTIVKAEYYRNAREVHYITENETEIWIDFATDQNEQIKKLNHVLAETDIFSKPLDHVDLRVQGRVYWQSK